ncbi:hypothetical protein OESDEN_18271 [Oesophagostomum dentatum]|uniref:Large ribosomal subunit protein uL23m n=1 Tax=Oesophagostomum dentatum TaxID=61180 RepID=A0A0B1S9Q5_OESDE|nr:hypothetical protein OESDEN_18271 [Oesophagostomum dentatum]
MTTRLARLWQPGNPQNYVFLPDFWVAVASNPSVGRKKLPRNCVKFEVDPRMSRRDVRDYLVKIYNLPVRDVRTETKMGEISWSTPGDIQYRKAMWKDGDKKFAYVFMKKGFEFTFPDIFPDDEEEVELQKVKDQQTKLTVNSRFTNRDRKGIGETFGV